MEYCTMEGGTNMELRHVYRKDLCAVGATALMPVYKLTDTDIVLMDTGCQAGPQRPDESY